MEIFLLLLSLVWLIIASFQDIKKREIPNWLSFSLIAFALSFRLFFSILNYEWKFFAFGLLGFILFFILAHLFYYARVFAGGDAKLLMGLGAVLPLANSFYANLLILGFFIFILLVVGGIYGLVYSAVLVSLNRKNFAKEFKRQLNRRRSIIYASIPLALFGLFFVLYFGDNLSLLLPFLILISPFFFIYAKAVENSCMIKEVTSKKVTVGDWLYEEVSVGGRVISPHWEGLDEEQVKLIRKLKKKIKIKQGIPFVPSFLLAFLAFLFLWYSSWSFFQVFWFFS